MKKFLLMFVMFMLFVVLCSCGQKNININTNGGEIEVTQESTIKDIVATIPVKEGYNFLGWYADKELTQKLTVNSDLKKVKEVYAKWEVIKFTITFDLNGGILESGQLTQEVDYGQNVILPVVSKDGCALVGWNGITENIKSDQTIKAIWKITKKYIVNFDPNGGELVSGSLSQEVVHGENAAAPIVSKEGYEFVRWNASINNVTNNINVKAEWIKIETHTINVRSTEATITDSGRFNQKMDTVRVVDYFNLKDLKDAGYTRFKVTIQFQAKEIYDGYRHIFFFSSSAKDNDYCLNGNDGIEFELGSGTVQKTYTDEEFTCYIDLTDLVENLYIRWGASDSGGLINEDDWVNKNVVLILTPVK